MPPASVLLGESTPVAPRISRAGYHREPAHPPLAGPVSVRLPRALRASQRVQLRAAPSQQADALPWVVQLPGALVLTTGRTQSGWVELHFAHGGKGWAPLAEFVNDNRHGWHGDAWEHCGGAEAAIAAHQEELLHVARQPPVQPTELAQGSFRVEKSGQQAHVWLPDVLTGRLPLLLVLHGSRPMDWDFLSFTERWQRDAQRHGIAILIPESRGPTWDYLLTGQRQDMDFIQFAMGEVCRQVPINGSNIAVMGMSDGGSLGLSMALRNPSLFRTALVQAVGFFVDARGDPPEKPRIFLEYGAKDRLFTPEAVARPLCARLQSAGYSVEFSMVPDAGHMVREEFFAAALSFWLAEKTELVSSAVRRPPVSLNHQR